MVFEASGAAATGSSAGAGAPRVAEVGTVDVADMGENPSVTHGVFGDIFPAGDMEDPVFDARQMGWQAVSIGVDRLSLSFDVRRFDPENFQRQGIVSHDAGSISRWSHNVVLDGAYKGVNVMLGVQEGGPHGLTGKIEVNPSRFYDPQGCGLVAPEVAERDLGSVLEAFVREQGIEPMWSSWNWKVMRVDLARDFRGVTSAPVLIEALRPLRRKYARINSVHFDASMKGAQTLTVGTSARMVRLYDQHAAYADKGAEPGSVRWEVQLRKDFLRKQGVERLSDLTASKMYGLAATEWQWSRMGTEIVMEEDAAAKIDRFVRSGELSATKAQRLLGQLVAEASGLSWTSDRKTSREYEDWKRTLGVAAGARPVLGRLGVAVPDTTTSARLDWETGYEVIVAA